MALAYRPSQMRQRARARKPTIFERTRPAPTKGWVTRKNIGQMKPDEALVLDNFFAREDGVYLRSGNSVHGTGMGTGDVASVIAYQSPTTNILLAAANGHIYNSTAAGAATSLASGFASNYWQSTQVEIAGSGCYTLLVNGVDKAQVFDGSTIAENGFTGIDDTKLINIHKHKRRVFAIEKDTLAFWYLPAVDTITGALSRFDLGPLCELGGYLMAMATWTRDGGSGMDDLAVFITSNGEVIIYQGNDPGDATDWSMIGVFRIAAPLGRRCWLKYASDVVVLTQDGFQPLSRVLPRDKDSQADVALSKEIAPTVTAAAKLYKNTPGWQGILYPTGRQLVVSVPMTTGATNVQWVMNTNTGAWCQYRGLKMNCMALMGDVLYFGSSGGKVWQFDVGTNDEGVAITGQSKQAFDYMGEGAIKSATKKFDLVRPILQSDGELMYGYVVNVDFEDSTPQATITNEGVGSPWDESPWDATPWSDPYTTFQEWRSAGAVGSCASLNLIVTSGTNAVGFLGVDWRGEIGHGLG